MSLVNWFRRSKVPQSSPRLEGLVLRVAQYLLSRSAINEFAAKIVGKAVGESELAALTALSILERIGVTKHHFGVYCKNTRIPLESYDDLGALSDSWYCEECDSTHSVSDGTCVVEIYFTVDKNELAAFVDRASAVQS